MIIYIYIYIYIHSSDYSPFLKGRGVDFNYLPQGEGESKKSKKEMEVWCKGRSS